MRHVHRLTIPLALLATACEPGSDPTAPTMSTPSLSAHHGSRTSVSPGLDAGFGPVVLASCEQGFDVLYSQEGTVTVIETIDGAGALTRLQLVWKTTITVANSVTGYSVSGPSRGPDQITLNPDGSTKLLQIGLVGSLRFEDGSLLTLDAGRIEFRIDGDDVSIVSMSGPHPHHEGFPERPVLCALLDG